MAYRFKEGQSVAENVRRIAREELAEAEAALGNASAANRDAAIHEARKGIKKLRGLLRLMRAELGSSYRRSISELRPIAGELSELRDAGAIIETFDAVAKGRASSRFSALRRELVRSKRRTEKSLDIAEVLRSGAKRLQELAGSPAEWKLQKDGFRALRPGLKKSYRAARCAFSTAGDKPTPENFHEWRKRVKDHWYHVRLLASVSDDTLKERESELHKLESALGEDHNLFVLRELLTQIAPKTAELPMFLQRAERASNDLRAKAIEAGTKLFEARPRAFLKQLEQLWETKTEHPKDEAA